MKTPAIIATATIAGSIAFAAGQQYSPRTPPSSGGQFANNLLSGKGRAVQSGQEAEEERIGDAFATVLGSSAQTCATATWFDPTPLPFDASCGRPVVTAIRAADVNGDGIQENFESGSIPLIFGGPWLGLSDIQIQPPLTDRLKHFEVVVDTAGPRSTGTSVLATPAEWATQLWDELGIGSDTDGCVDSWLVGAEIYGWADCDGDGDLDLVLRLTAYHRPRRIVSGICQEVEPIGYPIDRYHWLRNVGFEKRSPPLAADLNHDGKVDGADMGLLLYAWGQTQ